MKNPDKAGSLTSKDNDELFSVKDAARYLSVNPGTVRVWVHRREIAFEKIKGKIVRIRRSDCDRLRVRFEALN